MYTVGNARGCCRTYTLVVQCLQDFRVDFQGHRRLFRLPMGYLTLRPHINLEISNFYLASTTEAIQIDQPLDTTTSQSSLPHCCNSCFCRRPITSLPSTMANPKLKRGRNATEYTHLRLHFTPHYPRLSPECSNGQSIVTPVPNEMRLTAI